MRASPLRLRSMVLMAWLVLAAPAVGSAQGHFPSSEDAELMLRYLVEDGETPGIVLAFIDEDGSTRVLQYGEAGPGARALGRRSVFEIGSITKTFTAALLADMVARGEMALDDPVQDYLPEGVTMPGWEGRPITLMDLSTHHSGLPRMPNNFDPQDPANPYADYTSERLYEFLGSHRLRREPGTQYEYSNLAVGLLGHVLELATGRSYEALVRERILEPLEMTMTGITLEGDLADWMTKGHNPAGDVVPYWDVLTLAGAGGLRSNAEDMLTYVAAQLGPPENDIERAMRMTHEPRVALENGGAGGLGWGIHEPGERRVLTHGGGTAGYSTMIGFDPVVGVGVVMLTNTGGFGDDLGSDLLRRGSPISTPTVSVPPSVLEGYAGLYALDPGREMAIRLEEEGWLTMQIPDNVRFRLYAESDTSFYTRRTPWRVTFRTGEDGRATGARVDFDGTERTAARVDRRMPDPRILAGNAILRDDIPPLTAAEMAPYEGRYAVVLGGNTLVFRVFVEDGELRAQPEGQRSTRLVPQGDHTFIAAIDTDVRLVFHPADGVVDRVTLHDGDESAAGERLAPGESPPEPEVTDLPLSPEDVARYEGTYLLDLGARTLPLRIFGRDGHLVSRAEGQNEAPLRYLGDHTFVPDFDDRVRLIFTVEGGRATAVTLHQGGGVFRGERDGS